MLEQARRYRTLVVIVAAVAAIVFVPQRDGSVEGTAASGFAPGGRVATGGSGLTGTDPGAVTSDAPSGARTGAGPASAAGGAAAPGGSRGGPVDEAAGVAPTQATADGSVAVNGVSYPGIGTEAALSNPNCDPATKLVKVPDYMAAPCVAKWPAGADNLGGTAMGVTREAIRVVLPYSRSDRETDEDVAARKQQLKEIFYPYVQHNELWGRKLDLQFFEMSGTDEVAQRADAIEIFNKFKPFMVLDLTIGARPMVVRSAELAARGVMAWDHQPPWKDSQALAPLRFGVGHDERLFAEHIAEFAAKSLQGRPAKWAGDASMTVQERKFGLIYPDTWDIAFFNEAQKKYNLQVIQKVEYKTGDLTTYQEQVRTQVSKLAAAGVNNVLNGGELLFNVFLTREANAQGYFPEWTLTGWGVSDVSLGGRLYDPVAAQHMFGIGPVPVLVTQADQVTNRVFAWEFGRQPESAATAGTLALLLQPIMRGLQGAGPNLSPNTFRNAMFAAPPSGGAWCNCVTSTAESFGRWIKKPWDDYSAWDDMTLKWWKADEQGPDEIGIEAAGLFVMVEQGKRYVPDTYPTGEPPFFVNENIAHHMSFETMPPQDRWPKYQHSETLHHNYCGKNVDECFKGSN